MNHDDTTEQMAGQQPEKAAKHIDLILIAVAVLILLVALVYGILTST